MVFKGLPEGIHWSKRLFDFVFAGLGLFLLSPIILIIAILILILEGRPVFFKQERPGLHGEIFAMYKFRTMKCLKKHGREFPPDKRISRIGAFLRITSLDELPELINVLRGEMSLVGPRPLLVQYLKRYSNHQNRRHDALPGITGWAQVNGRNVQTWEQRFDYDVWYVDNWSFLLDLEILLKTLIIVVKHDDVSPTDGKIMEEFQGNPRPPRHERIPMYAMRKPSNTGLTAKTTGQTLASKPSLQ
ncbi:MAG: sugar transferase [Anaerolineaceae bacterium]|nr:sugar transferase [Anaerolineaceae bacterium]